MVNVLYIVQSFLPTEVSRHHRQILDLNHPKVFDSQIRRFEVQTANIEADLWPLDHCEDFEELRMIVVGMDFDVRLIGARHTRLEADGNDVAGVGRDAPVRRDKE